MFTVYSYFRTFSYYSYYDHTFWESLKEFYLFILFLVPGFFLNVWLSMTFKKYSFFLSNGITCGWFAVQIISLNFIRWHFESELIYLTVTGVIISALSLFFSLRKLNKYAY